MDGERLGVYFNSLEKDLPEYLYSLEKAALQNHVPIIKKQTQSLLRFLLKMKKPLQILEIGTAIGFSSLFMKEYMPANASITTIEKVEMRLVEARKNLLHYDTERKIKLIEGEALMVLEQLVKSGKETYDFIFLDAAKGQYMNFFPVIKTLLSEDGILISDNILQDGTIIESRYSITRRDRTIHGRMREYLYVLTHDALLETVLLPVADGVALTLKKQTEVNRKE